MKQQFLPVLNKYKSMKMHGEAGVQQQSFVISALDEGKWLATPSDRLTPGKMPKKSLATEDG
jgi:hypothetical protein